jgi:hypothetical protein
MMENIRTMVTANTRIILDSAELNREVTGFEVIYSNFNIGENLFNRIQSKFKSIP